VALLEDAAHLLRRASLDTLLCHWIGSVPFVLTLLEFWNTVTHPPVSDFVCAGAALVLALLLIWMNCWRSIFAGRLHHELSGTVEKPWTRRRVWYLVENQAFLAVTKLLVLPAALVAVFPFASTVAFYRNIPVLAGREDLDMFEVFAKARRLERGDKFQGWLLQFLLLLLSVVTLLNLAVTFGVLPQLVKMLTGYESAFTRSGTSFFENRLFLLFVIGATWLLFDPFVQAVYCLRCFGRESIETGEDLRVALRRVRSAIPKGAPAAALVLALAIPPAVVRAGDSVGPRELEGAVRQAMQSPEYNWRIPPPPISASETPWIILATDRAIAAVQSAMRWVGDKIDRLLRWIFGELGLSPMPLGGQAPGTPHHWSVWLLLSLAAAMAGWVLWRTLSSRRREGGGITARPSATAVRLDDEDLTADRLPEAVWLELAERCLRDGDLRLALRAFYLSHLAWLGREKFLTIDAGKTNREFELELRRRARQSAEARELFSANVRAFERAWYGLHDVHEEDTQDFRQRGEGMKARLTTGVGA
jgi:hypothetical protein